MGGIQPCITRDSFQLARKRTSVCLLLIQNSGTSYPLLLSIEIQGVALECVNWLKCLRRQLLTVTELATAKVGLPPTRAVKIAQKRRSNIPLKTHIYSNIFEFLVAH